MLFPMVSRSSSYSRGPDGLTSVSRRRMSGPASLPPGPEAGQRRAASVTFQRAYAFSYTLYLPHNPPPPTTHPYPSFFLVAS